MSNLAITNYPVNFEGAPYSDPARNKMKVRSRPLYDFSCWASKIIREFGQSFLQERIFYASSPQFKSGMDKKRLEESREWLRKIGGSSLVLKNPDGTLIEAMYFDVELFREIIQGKGGCFTRSPRGNSYILRSYNPELTEILTKMKMCPVDTFLDTYDEFLIYSAHDQAPLIEDKEPAITILTQGNACIFEMDRAQIIDTLLTGQSCIVFNIRGTGRSQGKPTEEGTYQDIETVYQFLKSRGKNDHLITVRGYCLGGGQASELAKRHPVNISLDRTFTSIYEKIGDFATKMAVDYLPKKPLIERNLKPISKVIEYSVCGCINRFMISYPVKENLKKVKGNVHIADATKDEVIPQGSGDALFAQISSPPNKSKARLVLKDHEHCDCWQTVYKEEYSNYLNKKEVNILREFGPTVPSKSLGEKAESYVEDSVNKSLEKSENTSRVYSGL